jgi:hypothetical protein
MDYAQKKLQRTHQLRKDEAASQEELDDWEHSYAVKELELQQLQDQHDKHFLHAPAAGMIDERLLDFAGAVTTTTPIFIFRGQDRPWRVTAELTQREVMQVQKGNSVRLVLPDTPTPDLQGIVIKIHPAQQNNLFPVEIELNSPPDSVQLKTSMEDNTRLTTYPLAPCSASATARAEFSLSTRNTPRHSMSNYAASQTTALWWKTTSRLIPESSSGDSIIWLTGLCWKSVNSEL